MKIPTDQQCAFCSYLLAMLGSRLYPSRRYSSAMWSSELMTLSSQSIVYGSAKSTSMPTSRVLFSTRSGSYSCQISNFPAVRMPFFKIHFRSRTVYQMFLMAVAPTTAPLAFSLLPPRNLVKSTS